jgi:hypothetical protein
VHSPFALEEPDARSAALHEQEVHVPAALEHVPQEPVVAVTLVEGRVGKEADPRSSGKHAAKRLRGSARVALVVSGLGRVDLQQANGRPSVSSIVSPSTTRVTTAPGFGDASRSA